MSSDGGVEASSSRVLCTRRDEESYPPLAAAAVECDHYCYNGNRSRSEYANMSDAVATPIAEAVPLAQRESRRFTSIRSRNIVTVTATVLEV